MRIKNTIRSLILLATIVGCRNNTNSSIAKTKDYYFDKGKEIILKHVLVETMPPKNVGAEERAEIMNGIYLLDTLTQLEPQNFAPYFFKGKGYQRLHDFENAYNEFYQSFSLEKGNPDVARELMITCLDLGKNQQAVFYGEHALSLNNNEPGLMANLSLAYLLIGKNEVADALIKKAIELNPGDQVSKRIKKIIDEVIIGERPQPTHTRKIKK